MTKTKVSKQTVTTVSNSKKTKGRRVIAGFRTMDGFIRRSVAAVLIIALCSFTGDPCKAIKKDGTRCKSTIVSKATGYCNAHDPNAKKCVFIKKDGERCKMTVKADQTHCRFHIDK
jgi:hypothetical protein